MRLGEILVAANACDEGAITQALEHSRFSDNRLGAALIELDLVSSDIVAAALAKQHGVSAAKEANFDAIEPAVIKLLSGTQAYQHQALPLGIQRATGQLAVAIRDPSDLETIEALRVATEKDIIAAAASEQRIRQGLFAHYGPANYGPAEILPITPQDDSLELELAPLPALKAKAPAIASRITEPAAPAPLPSAKATVQSLAPKFDLRAFLGTGRGIFIAAVASVVLLAVGKYAYEWVTDKDIPVSGTFKADSVNLKLTLPNTGWIYAPSADMDYSQGRVDVAIAMLYRGKSVHKPDDALWLMQVSGPFPNPIPDSQFDQLSKGLNQLAKQRQQVSGFTFSELECGESARRPGRTAECTGSGTYEGTSFKLSAFLWQERDGSIVAAAFLTTREFSSFDDEIDSIIATIRLL